MKQEYISLKTLITNCISHWILFAACLAACTAIALAIYIFSPRKYTTEMVYKVRDNEQERMFKNISQDASQAIMDMGFVFRFTDEQELVNSHDLMREVVRQLDAQIECMVKHPGSLRWEESALPADLLSSYRLQADTIHRAQTTVVRRTNGDKLRIKTYPLNARVDQFCKQIKSERVNQECQVLHLTATTKHPLLAEQVMTALLQQYNIQRAADLHLLADSIDAYLAAQIEQEGQVLDTMSKATKSQQLAYDSKLANYQYLLQCRERNRLYSIYSIEPLHVLDSAYTLAIPQFPKLPLLLAIALMLGLLLPLLYVTIKEA